MGQRFSLTLLGCALVVVGGAWPSSSGWFVLVPAPGITANSNVELAREGWSWT